MAFSTSLNQAAIASLNQATIARGEIASDKPYHSTSAAHFTNEAQALEYRCLMGQVAGDLPVCHRLGLLYQFYPDARDDTWTELSLRLAHTHPTPCELGGRRHHPTAMQVRPNDRDGATVDQSNMVHDILPWTSSAARDLLLSRQRVWRG